MDTEIIFSYKDGEDTIVEYQTLDRGIYKGFIGKKVKCQKILKYANLTAKGNEDCQNFLDLIKNSLKFEYDDFSEFYSRLKKLELVEFNIDMY